MTSAGVTTRLLSYGNHDSQFGMLRRPESAERCPVIVSIHGGFWQPQYGFEVNEPLAEDLARRGYVTWNMEYRRIGQGGGGWPGTFEDVTCAVNHLSQLEHPFRLDLSRVILLGHSAGGHLALWLASRIGLSQTDELGDRLHVPISGIVSLAGVSDLRKMWQIHKDAKRTNSPVASLVGGSPNEVPHRYALTSPIELLPLNVPQHLIHGELDADVPVEQSVAYQQRTVPLHDDVTLMKLPGAGHFEIIDPTSPVWNTVISSIETLLHM